MNEFAEKPVDVVVVGAGPVGLLVAIELTLGGASVLVLERLAEPSRVMKALGTGPLGIEAMARRGLAADISAAESRAMAAMQQITGQDPQAPRSRNSRFSGHFAGLSLLRTDAQKEPERRGRMVNQQEVETMLMGRAMSAGIEVRRECEVTGISQDEEGVEAEWTSPAGGERLRCAYLVGCDGGRSSIRKMAGFHFPGTPPTLTMYQAIVDVDPPESLSGSGWRRTPGGVFSTFAGRLIMLDFSGPPADRDAPVTREEIEAVLRRVSGLDVEVKRLQAASRWTDHTRLVDTYRQGRVLLAGDAAHVHSPFGGQGLSLGLVDAANLGWKLAAVLRKELPESLLDTYTAERRPVAEAVLANTLAQVAIMRPDPQSGAMRDLMVSLLQLDDVNQLIGGMMSGLSVRYDLGSTQDGVGRLISNRTITGHDGAGLSLYDLMQDGCGVLLDASGDGWLSGLVEACAGRIRCVAIENGPSMLIRPDACVVWLGDESDAAALEAELQRWFSPASQA